MQKRWSQNQDSQRVPAEESDIQYNKLFVLSGTEPSEVEFRSLFGKYGEVEELKQINNRDTGKFKGVNFTDLPVYTPPPPPPSRHTLLHSHRP